MNNFIDMKNNDVVKMAPILLNKDYVNNILKILRKKYEGVCSKFGYIKEQSIKIDKVTQGTIELSTFHGYVLFDVEFTSSVCNPAIGSVVECVVKNINAFGVLCTSGIMVDNKYSNILNIVIPKNNSQFMNNASIIENVVVNDVVYVEILGKKYILRNKNINVFGKLIKGSDTIASDGVKTDQDDNKLELEDDEIEVIGVLGDEEFEDNEDDKSEDNTVLSDTVDELDIEEEFNEDVLSEVDSDNEEDYF
jgi:DNA-directed RNA polymerase subunit E'/Rpb7